MTPAGRAGVTATQIVLALYAVWLIVWWLVEHLLPALWGRPILPRVWFPWNRRHDKPPPC